MAENDLRVFLSWSGPQSQAVASALFEWLPLVLQRVKPWMSKESIEGGKRWSLELSTELQANGYGIVCVTADTTISDWMLFEAGALSKVVNEGRVCPYLLNLPASNLTGPLAQFQAVVADRDDTLRLVKALNGAQGGGLDDAALETLFTLLWPHLETKLQSALVDHRVTTPTMLRPIAEMVEEILAIVRAQSRTRVEPSQAMLRQMFEGFNPANMPPEVKDKLLLWEDKGLYSFAPGSRVLHARYGPGVVSRLAATTGDLRMITVRFDDPSAGLRLFRADSNSLSPLPELDGTEAPPEEA